MEWACLDDHAPLNRDGTGGLSCPRCERRYAAVDGLPVFAKPDRESPGVRHEPPALRELWAALEQKTPDEAAEAFCATHGCSRHRFTTDWSFFLPLPEGGTVLELGAGFGDDTVELDRRAATTVSLVPSVINGRILHRRLQHDGCSNTLTGVLGELTRLPLPTRSVDAVAVDEAALAGFGLTGQQLASAAAEWRRVLKPDGSLYVGVRNGGERWPGIRRLRSLLRSSDAMESLNRRVKRLAAPKPASAPGLGTTVRCLRRVSFGPPRVYAPLPDERDITIVLPIEDDRIVRYCFDHLVRKNSLAVRAALVAANLSSRLNLLRRLVPYYFLIFTPDRVGEAG